MTHANDLSYLAESEAMGRVIARRSRGRVGHDYLLRLRIVGFTSSSNPVPAGVRTYNSGLPIKGSRRRDPGIIFERLDDNSKMTPAGTRQWAPKSYIWHMLSSSGGNFYLEPERFED